jgi:hypothetical protein
VPSYTATLVSDPAATFFCEPAEAPPGAAGASRRTIAGAARRSSSNGLA